MTQLARGWIGPVLGGALVVAILLSIAVASGAGASTADSRATESVAEQQARTAAADREQQRLGRVAAARDRVDRYAERARVPLATTLELPARVARVLRGGTASQVDAGLRREELRMRAAARQALAAAPTDDPELYRAALTLEQALLQQAAMLRDARSALRGADQPAARRSRAHARAAGLSMREWSTQVTTVAASRGSDLAPIDDLLASKQA